MRSGHTFLLLAAALAISGCNVLVEDVTVPRELIGVWGTTYPKYMDRTFEFTEGAVIFQTGNGPFDFTAHPIHEISVEQVMNRTDYEIEYGTIEAGSYVFAFSYFPRDGGLIRFANQSQMTWKLMDSVPYWY